MVTLERIKNGISAYCDAELLPKLPSGKAVLVGTILVLYLNQLDTMIDKIPESLHIKNGKNIDIDAIKNAIKSQMRTDVAFDIPLIGTITIDQSEIDKIYRYIMSET